MSKILLKKTEPFSPARYCARCGNAAAALDRIVPQFAMIPLPLGGYRELMSGEGMPGEGEKEVVLSGQNSAVPSANMQSSQASSVAAISIFEVRTE